MDSYFDRRFFVRTTIWMLLLLLACKLTSGFAFIVMIPVAVTLIAMGKNESLLFVVLFATFAMTMGNFFIPKTLPFLISQKVLLVIVAAVLAVRVFGRRHSKCLTPILWFLPYLIYMLAVSQVGWAPLISNMKILLFTTVFFAMYGASVQAALSYSDVRKIRSMFLALAAFLIFGSFLVRPIPSIGMMSGEEVLLNPEIRSLFRGVTNHSQSLGVICAAFGVFLYVDLLFSIRQKSRMYLSLLAGALVLIWWSGSRTALATFLFGVGFATYCAMASRAKVGRVWRRRVINNIMLLGMLGLCLGVAVPSLREKIARFIVKYDSSSKVYVSSESINSSRRQKYDFALANWKQSPLLGNGFQVSQEMSSARVTSIKNMLSAPVEKCTWLYAVLEEGGVLGMSLFVLFILFSLLLLVARKAYMCASVLAMFIFSNLGEFTICSMSAGGGLFWCMVFVSAVFDQKRISEDEQLARYGMMRP